VGGPDTWHVSGCRRHRKISVDVNLCSVLTIQASFGRLFLVNAKIVTSTITVMIRNGASCRCATRTRRARPGHPSTRYCFDQEETSVRSMRSEVLLLLDRDRTIGHRDHRGHGGVRMGGPDTACVRVPKAQVDLCCRQSVFADGYSRSFGCLCLAKPNTAMSRNGLVVAARPGHGERVRATHGPVDLKDNHRNCRPVGWRVMRSSSRASLGSTSSVPGLR
jgi:hypothetical protein